MPIPEKSEQIDRIPMRDKVYDTLLEWIIQGDLQQGEKLLDKELAENLGVSRTPVREALRRLEDKKLVEASASRWTRVAKISRSEAELFYPIIWTLETLVVSMAMDHITADDVYAMETANRHLKKAIISGDPMKASKADADFHDVLIKRSNNLHLSSILYDLKIKHCWMVVRYFEENTEASASVDEHNQILAAMKAKDTVLTTKLIVSNWKKSMQRMLYQTAGGENGCKPS
jgi:DNA-binding GntR family transcriptional regulator